jgi:hypothetical membrane protein
MMRTARAGVFGIAACGIFWTASFVFGALRPSYSHTVNTISELGARGTPHATSWNVVGFVVPGLLLAITGRAIARSIIGARSWSTTLAGSLLFLAGLAIAAQGIIPADMTNGVADITSPHTRGHFISSLVSGAAWAIGAVMLVGPMKRSPTWHGWHIVSIGLVLLAVGASLALRGTLPDGLAQRLGDALFFVWFVLMSVKLIRLERRHGPASQHLL